MFSQLSDRLADTIKKLRGKGKLNKQDIESALREIRTGLLDADVALDVVKPFIEKVNERATGVELERSISPSQAITKIVQQELSSLMGSSFHELNLKTRPPAVLLVAGLQGVGKTTTVAKIGHWLKTRKKKTVMVVSIDIHRPAAIKQLGILAQQNAMSFYQTDINDSVALTLQRALKEAVLKSIDVVIVDSAGRLHIDDKMMEEIRHAHAICKPIETLLVVDSMSGQDAVNSAKSFSDSIAVTGVVLSKTDGDTRGGVALSIRARLGLPVKFIGTGERVDALDVFHPDRVASQILGQGDMLSLVEDIKRVSSKNSGTISKNGQKFHLGDYKEQMLQMLNMGGMTSLMNKLPLGQSKRPNNMDAQDRSIRRNIAIINSMTVKERRNPDILRSSEKKRVASGAGVGVQDINMLLKQFHQIQKMMKKMSKKGGMKSLLRQMGNSRPPSPPNYG